VRSGPDLSLPSPLVFNAEHYNPSYSYANSAHFAMADDDIASYSFLFGSVLDSAVQTSSKTAVTVVPAKQNLVLAR